MTVPSREGRRLAQPGRNCSAVARAGRFGLAVDGECYYRALAHSLSRARRSILMLGWEFDSRTRLLRDHDRPQSVEIGALLDGVVRARPGLTAHVLIWDSALIYAFSREFFGIMKMGWLTDRRLRFCLDDSHPLGASHHQKIVVIDDALAFVGGLDVSSQRWDSRAHLADDRRRSDPAVARYPPFHDMMAVVTGEAARALGDVCRRRWLAATGRSLRPVPAGDASELWPPGVAPLMHGVDVALALTSPPWDGHPAIREVETLYVDMIAAARRSIYVENQYFASRRIAEAIEARLACADCPEIVVVNPGDPVSLVERSTMGVARARLYRRLMAVDHGRRLRIYYPVVGDSEVKIHSKLMVVDDVALRVGSANLNNRSMGLDTECDVVVEAGGDPAVAAAIARVRLDLLAEHLGVPVPVVAAAEAATGSLHGAIARLGHGDRRLVELGAVDPSNVVEMIADSGIPDPEEPVETLVWLEESMPGPAKRPLQVRVWGLAGLLALLALVGVLWRWAPPEVWGWVVPRVAWLSELGGRPETSGVRLRDFVVGTVLGMVPGIFAMSVVGDRLVAVLRNPSMVNIVVLAAAASVAIAAVFGLVDRLARARSRQVRPAQKV